MTTVSYVFEITLNTCCLLFIVFLAIIYSTKKIKNNLENKLYKILLSTSIIDIVFELLYIFSTRFIYNEFPISLAKKSFFCFIDGYYYFINLLCIYCIT